MFRFVPALIVLTVAGSAMAQINSDAIPGRPAWFTIKSDDGATSKPVMVRDGLTNQPLGAVLSGTDVLSLGYDKDVITIAVNGRMGIVDRKHADPKYPLPSEKLEWKSSAEGLEAMLKRERETAKERRKNLSPRVMATPRDYTEDENPNGGGAQNNRRGGAGAGGGRSGGGI